MESIKCASLILCHFYFFDARSKSISTMSDDKENPDLPTPSAHVATGQTVSTTYGLNSVPKDKKLTTVGMLKVIGGFLYLIGTCACSIYYLTFLFPSIQTDVVVPDFENAQVFLGDLYNHHVETDAGKLNLFSKKESLDGKDYDDPNAVITMFPTRERSTMYDYIKLEDAIQAVRNVDMITNMRVWPAVCWLDYQRLWELAHTARRQENCYKRSTWNGAFYLESLFRNVASKDLTSSQYYHSISHDIFSYVVTQPSGDAWVKDIIKRKPMRSIEDEAAEMRRNGIVMW
jgi:hypothetical protein